MTWLRELLRGLFSRARNVPQPPKRVSTLTSTPAAVPTTTTPARAQTALASATKLQRALAARKAAPEIDEQFAELGRNAAGVQLDELREPVVDYVLSKLAKHASDDALAVALDLHCRHERLQAALGRASKPSEAMVATVRAHAELGSASVDAVRAYLDLIMRAAPQASVAQAELPPDLAHIGAALQRACDLGAPHALAANTLALDVGAFPWAAHNLGRLALAREDFAGAQREFERSGALAAQANRTVAIAPLDRGLVHLGLGEFEEAAVCFAAVDENDRALGSELGRTSRAAQHLCNLASSRAEIAGLRALLEDASLLLANPLSGSALIAHPLSACTLLQLRRRLGPPSAAVLALGEMRLAPAVSLRLRAELVELKAELGIEVAADDVAAARGKPLAEVLPIARRLLALGRLTLLRSIFDAEQKPAAVEAELLAADARMRTDKDSLSIPLPAPVHDASLASYALELRLRRQLEAHTGTSARAVVKELDGASGLLLPRPALNTLRAEAYEALGRAQDALAHLGTLVKLTPGSSPAWVACGFGHLCLGHDARAAGSFELARQLNPEDAYAALGAGLCAGGGHALSAARGLEPELAILARPIARRLARAGRHDLLRALEVA